VAEHPGAARWSARERRRHAAALMAGITPETALTCAWKMLQGQAPRI
jgi:hypothetical protein